MAYSNRIQLASNAGVGNSDPVAWPGGIGTFEAVSGTWGGGSVKLQMLASNGTTWLDLPDVVLSANSALNFELAPAQLRAVIATATAVYASVGLVSR